eukprot:scaffold202958_cov33-Tisochrysis_lutea.AAC.5
MAQLTSDPTMPPVSAILPEELSTDTSQNCAAIRELSYIISRCAEAAASAARVKFPLVTLVTPAPSVTLWSVTPAAHGCGWRNALKRYTSTYANRTE